VENKKKFRPDPSLKVMDQVREVLRYCHYAYRTEETCCDWIRRYLKFYDYKKPPMVLTQAEVQLVLPVWRKGVSSECH